MNIQIKYCEPFRGTLALNAVTFGTLQKFNLMDKLVAETGGCLNEVEMHRFLKHNVKDWPARARLFGLEVE